jgi:predicted acylesterase/phospholipase RssA
MSIEDMRKHVFSIRRGDIWDVGLGFGLLKGQLVQELLERMLPVHRFEDCKIPLGVAAYDVYNFKTNCISTGDIATAIRASACFPVLFQPVMIDSRPHIDGGVWDDGGLMALTSVPESKLVVNIVCGRGRIGSSKLPEKFKDARVSIIVA